MSDFATLKTFNIFPQVTALFLGVFAGTNQANLIIRRTSFLRASAAFIVVGAPKIFIFKVFAGNVCGLLAAALIRGTFCPARGVIEATIDALSLTLCAASNNRFIGGNFLGDYFLQKSIIFDALGHLYTNEFLHVQTLG